MDLQEILKENGLTQKDLAGLFGMNYHYMRKCSMVSRAKKPYWVQAFVIGYEMGQINGAEKKSNPAGCIGMEVCPRCQEVVCDCVEG